MKAYFKILRPDEAFIMAMPVVIMAIVGHTFNVSVLLASILVFFMAGAGNVINDVFDYEIDAVNKPDRPIPSGKISLRNARIYAAVLYSIAILLGVIISCLIRNFIFLAIIIASAVIIYAYSRYFKAMPLIGNIVVGVMIGLCFVVGGFILLCDMGDRTVFKVSVYIGLLAAVANVARELVKDMEDVHGDQLGGARTFPVLYGKKISAVIAMILLVVAVAVCILLYTSGLFNIAYFVIIIIPVALCLYPAVSFFASKFEPDEATCAKDALFLKIAMAVSLLAIIIGSINF
jgi:geranylgeranylglycerol-phosphate geranylgeranyltransferase